MFWYVNLEAVSFFPLVTPRIFALPAMVEFFDTTGTQGTYVLTASQFAAWEACQYPSYQVVELLLHIAHSVCPPPEGGDGSP